MEANVLAHHPSPAEGRQFGHQQRALKVGPWRENALMVEMTTIALFLLLPGAAANTHS
jgi:hypothetical protein